VDIELTARYGDQEKKVRIAFVHGAAGVIHIYIDDWYHGQVVKIAGQWEVYLNAKSDLCSNDILTIKELIEKRSSDV